jgi:hypothetical protein
MQEDKHIVLIALSFAFFTAVGQSAIAADLELELEAGIGQTDNITRVPDTILTPAIDDVVYSAGLSLSYQQESARSEVDVRASLYYLDYKDGPFDSETLPALDASALFRLTKQSLSWFFQGNIGQQSTDPFQPVTPDNRENVSYITTGPSLFVPIGTRFSIRSDAYYSDVQYEIQPFDNARTGIQVAFARQISTNRSLSLNVRGERTEFDLDLLFDPIERYDVFLQFATEGSRNELTIDLGFSTLERSGVESENPLVNLVWRRQVSQATNMTLTGGTRFSDSAENFRGNQQGSIDIGDSQNQQSVSDPFRENYASFSVAYNGARTNMTGEIGWSDEDYDERSQLNRQLQRGLISITRQLGSSWDFGVFGRFDNYEYDVLLRKDDDINFGSTITWRRLRTVNIDLRIERFDRDSTDLANIFTENRVYLGFRYIPSIGG